ncbi:hypothetical protein [Bacillus cereus group sp. Bce015]
MKKHKEKNNEKIEKMKFWGSLLGAIRSGFDFVVTMFDHFGN